MELLPEKPRLTPGAGKFRFTPNGIPNGVPSGMNPRMMVYYYLPGDLPQDAPVVFVMHGTKRDAEIYRDTWAAAAELYRFALICPRFRKRDYPRGMYHRGNVTDDAGQPTPKNERTFSVIETLFDHARERLGNTSETYRIYGHSAGGQFVHRMVMFAPESRIHTAVAANTGWYTMPDETTDFPYGTRGSGADLEAAFARRLVVLLGEGDTDPEDPFLRTTEEALAQGATRYERGHTFYETARRQALELEADLAWKLVSVPGATHLDRQMMPSAVREMFGGANRPNL